MPEVDWKPRSRVVTDGIEATTSRGMLRAVGMGDEDWEKPQIGIASSWNEITPCNLSLDRLAQGAKEGVHSGGGYPLQFGTISVSDGISMGHEGMHFSLVSREIIADSVETVMNAERLDGSVLLAGCDKSLPGMLMAAARLDLASVFLYAGSIMPGNVDGRDVTIIDAFEAVGACLAGKITRDEVDRIEKAICPGEGACGGMYTANTMASAAEALGLSLTGSAAPPAPDSRRDAYAERSGEAVVKLVDADGLTPIEFGDVDALDVGDRVVAIGAPLGLSNTVTDGIVSALNRSISIASSAAPKSSDGTDGNGNNGQQNPFNFDFPGQGGGSTQQQQSSSGTISLPVIQTDASINPGNSGGALLNSKGELIGVNVAIASAGGSSSSSGQSGSIGVGFAIPSNLAKRVSDEIIKNGYATHAVLGASVQSASTADQLDSTGAQIASVTDGGAAAKAGLKAGDVVTKVGSQSIESSDALVAAIRSQAPGGTVDITYLRGSHRFDANRLRFEYRDSVAQSTRTTSLLAPPPSFTETFGAEPAPIEGGANTLVIFNTMGLHRRGTFGQPGERRSVVVDWRMLDAMVNLPGVGRLVKASRTSSDAAPS